VARQSGRRRWGRAQDDRIPDPYKEKQKLQEPSVCSQCGAVFHEGRWHWAARPEGAQEALCHACHRIKDDYPAGIVTLSGPVVAQHRAEIVQLARHQEESEKKEHPMNRIMAIEEGPDQLTIKTTDIHLPRRIGDAMKRAYHGKLATHFDEQGYFARVTWERQGE
jgi:hypothetical protein